MIRRFLSSAAVRYGLSSFLAFLIDYGLLLFLDSVIPAASMELGALGAWIASSLVNFEVNRRWVFHSEAPISRALADYFGLAAVVFLAKTYVLMELLTRLFDVPLALAKPIAETVFFIGNYIVQKRLIFSRKSKEKRGFPPR